MYISWNLSCMKLGNRHGFWKWKCFGSVTPKMGMLGETWDQNKSRRHPKVCLKTIRVEMHPYTKTHFCMTIRLENVLDTHDMCFILVFAFLYVSNLGMVGVDVSSNLAWNVAFFLEFQTTHETIVGKCRWSPNSMHVDMISYIQVVSLFNFSGSRFNEWNM